ncbi:MAG: acetate--CoA ligase family protein [Candidatus Diapherotrites archaeon]|nr:acetate--CoA ligase family protein [Candidatus Diapherotrites archaeon]
MARQQLSFSNGIKLLEEYKIPVAKTKVVRTLNSALRFADEIGYPVVLKIDSPDIVHKSDKGFVITEVKDEKALKTAYNKLMRKAKGKRVRGIIVQEQTTGVEVIIGGKIDPQFGEVVIFGLGGIFVEIIKDISVRITPITKEDAKEMIKEIRGYPLLAGARGRKPVDMDAIADIIIRIAKLHTKRKDIVELDLNPVFVDEHGAKVVDVRMIREVKR